MVDSLTCDANSHNNRLQIGPKSLSVCMVRRRVASEKRAMANGLRQCIRSRVESWTRDIDGCRLELVQYTSRPRMDLYRYQVSRAWERPMAICVFRQQTRPERFCS